MFKFVCHYKATLIFQMIYEKKKTLVLYLGMISAFEDSW